MKLYHASTNHYAKGEVVGPFVQTRFFENKIVPTGLQSVECLLEQARPETKFSRLKAVYAFAEPGQCIIYLHGEGVAQFFLYEVAMDSTTICPMLLVDFISRYKCSAQVTEALTKEYWDPKMEWRLTKYLAGSLQIVAEVDKNKYTMQSYAAHLACQEDTKQASALVSSFQASIKEIDIP